MMKQIIFFALLVSRLVYQLQATEILLVFRPKNKDQTVKDVIFEGKTIADMKLALQIETDVEIVDQRLFNWEEPIIDEKLVSDLTIDPRYGKPMVVLTVPLGINGEVFVWGNNKEWKISASGGETLGEFRKKVRPGKLLFGEFELKDDTKTLDYYQIGWGQYLTLERA